MGIKISVVVSMYNRKEEVLGVIDKLFFPSLINNASKEMELILIDDCSPLSKKTDKLVKKYRGLFLKKFGVFKYVKNKKNLGFADSYNKGLKLARGELIMVVNDDIYLPKKSIKRLCDTAKSNDKIGVVGPVTNYSSSFQNTHLFTRLKSYSNKELQRIEKFSEWLEKVMAGKTYSVNKIIGFCVVYKKKILREVGYFNVIYDFEDDDLHLRIKNKNYSLIVDADVFVEHGGIKGGSVSVFQHKYKHIKNYIYVVH